MHRRSFITLFGAASWALAASAQQPAKAARIGWMSQGNARTPDANTNAFREGMRELGYAEGHTFVIEARYADGNVEVLAAQAAELERLGVDVIVAGPFAALQAAKSNTSRVPIIMTPSADPVVAGIVDGLDRPGGNITGITEMMPELAAPRFALLKEIDPALRRVAVLWGPGTLTSATIEKVQRDIETSANAGVQLVSARGLEGLDAAFSTIKASGSKGLIVLVNPIFFGQRKQIIDRAAEARLSSIYEWKAFAQSGGLISYGAVVTDVYRRAAGYVDKILRGANPGDLPVEAPKKTELVVNLKTAKELGLMVPPSLIARADEIIE
jgi:putative ABC transport system substrate-binding protein